MSVWDRRKEILYSNGSIGEIGQNNPTLQLEINGTECYDGWVWVIIITIIIIINWYSIDATQDYGRVYGRLTYVSVDTVQ